MVTILPLADAKRAVEHAERRQNVADSLPQSLL